MSSKYDPIRPLAEATHAFVAEQAQKAGHDVQWYKPREVHGFIQRHGDCRRCKGLAMFTVAQRWIKIEMDAACPGEENPVR